MIKRFLKAGYYEFNKVNNSYSGCPQGSIISPILSNIYLNEFDKYMEKLILSVNKGDKKRATPEYKILYSRRETARRSGMSNDDIMLGFHHSIKYWSKGGKKEAEAWAQFGRISFDNNPEVFEMFETVFTNFSEYAIMLLKEMV